MKKNYPNKMVKEEEVETKKSTILICARECVILGIGSYQAGDRLTLPALVKQLSGHPNFEIKQEETKP